MDTQVKSQVESQVFIPDLPSSHATRRTWTHCMVALVTVMVLAIFAALAGLCISVSVCNLQHKTEKPGQTNCAKRFNETFKLKLRRTDKEDQYTIFTVHKDATYFLHGEVRLTTNQQETIFLETQWKDKTTQPLFNKTYNKTYNVMYSEIIFAGEYKLLKNERVYLVFNFRKPNLDETAVHVYEL